MPEPQIVEPFLGVNSRESVVRRTFTVLAAFWDDRPLTLGEIVLRTALPKPTVYRLTMSLVEIGFLDRVARGFRVNPRFYALSHLVSPYKRLERTARPHLVRLFQQVREQVSLQVMTDDLVVMRLEYVSDQSSALPHRGGVVFWTYPHVTGGGKCLLAFGPEDRVDRFLERPLIRRTEHTITEPDEFRRGLAEVKRRGFAICREESRPGWVTVAAPVLDTDGEALAAVSVVGTTRMDAGRAIPLVMHAARTISSAMQSAANAHWTE